MKQETRIIPEETNPKFYAEHLKPYKFLENYAKGKKVLEIGCGDGYGSAYLAKVASEVVGIDYEADIILQAKDKYNAPNLRFIEMDATNLQFTDNLFDIACSFQVIEHIPEEKLIKYLSEVKRVLKKGGKFFLSTLNLNHTMKSLFTYTKNSAHCKEFRLEELKALLTSAFPTVEIYGLHLTLRHGLYQRLKKIGIFNFLPDKQNPVKRFYNKITTGDFIITPHNLQKAIDFICICSI